MRCLPATMTQKSFFRRRSVFLLCLALIPLGAGATNWVQVVPDVEIDMDSIHEDNRLPIADRYGKPIEGKSYAATFLEKEGLQGMWDSYSVDDPKVKKYLDAWDVHQAVRYFLCQKNYSLMTLEEGPVVDHLRGTWMRAYDGETLWTALKRRQFIDWTTMPEGRWTGMYGAAVRAGKIICDKAASAASQ